MRTGTAAPPTGGNFSPVAPFVQPGAPKARRQPALLALGVALIGVSAAGFVYWNQKVDTRSSVLVVARDVPYGQKLTADDLRVAQMTLGDGVKAIGASSESTVLSESATTQLHAGSLLSPADVSTAPGTPPGTSILVANLKPDLIPPGLTPGRQVVLVGNNVVIDPNSKVIQSQPLPAAGLAAETGGKVVTFKATVVSLTGTKATFAISPTDAPMAELFADEGRIGVVVPPSDS
jgi:hypothetical protein